MDKKELRKKVKELKLTEEYISLANKEITLRVLSSEEYKNAKSIFIYISTEDEVDTSLIIKWALKDGKEVYVPKCIDSSTMKLIRIDEDSEYSISSYGIKEPISDKYYEANVDLSIIPCVSLSKDLKRLGHGAGYYDRYLKDHPTYKMALCFRIKMSNQIEMDDHDIYMDKVIYDSI